MKKNNIQRKERRRGFSLLEVLIVVAIAGTIIAVVSGFGNNVTGLNQLITSELQAKSDISQSLQIMTAEIQSAMASASGAYPISFAGTSSFAFYSDIKKNGTAEWVNYYYATSTIYKAVIVPTGTPALYPTSGETIIPFINNVIIPSGTVLFSYYDSSYTGTQSPMAYPLAIANIRLVGIAFFSQTNQTSTVNQSPLEHFYSLVDIRNLDSN